MPSKSEVQAALRKLTQTQPTKSATQQLREIFDDVESTLASGVSLENVRQTLLKHGFVFTQASLKSALYRIRSERKAQPSRRK